MPSIDWQTIVAGLALIFSVYTFRKTQNLAEKQVELVEDQKRLNRLLLAKEQEAAVSSKRADLSARLVKLGKGYSVKVFNRGNAVARNVRLLVPDGTTLLIQSDVDAKFPLEHLEPQSGVDLIARVYIGSASKQSLSIFWEDDHAAANEKTVYLTT